MRIGVFGLSGVGKSFLVEQFISTNTNFISTKASQLIAQASKNIQFDKLTPFSVDDNQLALVEGFKVFCTENNDINILIELHNLIETPSGVIEIDDNILYALNLDAVCFLFKSPEKIHNQRSNDKSRTRAKTTISKLDELQKQSLLRFKTTFSNRKEASTVLTENHLENFSLFIKKLS